MQGGGVIKTWQNSVHVVVECLLRCDFRNDLSPFCYTFLCTYFYFSALKEHQTLIVTHSKEQVMPDENYQNLSNLSSNISYLLIETFEKYLLDKSQTMENLKFAYFFKIKDPCKIFSKRISKRGVLKFFQVRIIIQNFLNILVKN